MHRILPLLGDVGLGIIVIVAFLRFHGIENNWFFVLFPLAFAPDLDALGEVWARGYVVASAENPIDHREMLHKPLLWFLPIFVLYPIYPEWMEVSFCLILAHFVHDSVLTGWGVQWLWPLTDARIRFFTNMRNENSLRPRNWIRVYPRHKLRGLIEEYGDADWIQHLYLRLTPVSVIEYAIFLCSLRMFFWHLSA